MYWSLDYHQVAVQIQIKHNISVSKRSTDHSLDLSLRRANEIRISIISARVVPPSSHMVDPKPNEIHILKNDVDQVLSDHPSLLR